MAIIDSIHLLTSLLQGVLLLLLAPALLGVLDFWKALLNLQRPPRLYQHYVDLWVRFRQRGTMPEHAAVLFRVTPSIVLAVNATLLFVTPLLARRVVVVTDLLGLFVLLGVPKFLLTLNALDTSKPLEVLGAGREMYMHLVLEPGLIMSVYVLAFMWRTTDLSGIYAGMQSQAFIHPVLLPVGLVAAAVGLVALAANGHLPLDDHHSQLELTWIQRALTVDYSGSQLALLEVADTLRLAFYLGLWVNLVAPVLPLQLTSPAEIVGAVVLWLVKSTIALGIVAVWDVCWHKWRLRQSGMYGLWIVGINFVTVVFLILLQIIGRVSA